MYRLFGLLVALLVLLALGRQVIAAREQVFSGKYLFDPGKTETAFVTDPFTLRAAGTAEISFNADLANSWLDFDIALINADSGTAWNVARELSYYTGRDSDGPWTEGSTRGRVLIPTVPAGEYYLRVEPAGEPGARQIPYTIQVRRDVPSVLPYGLALLLLLVPPVFTTMRAASFEQRRMQESDHAG
jgi:hypothetical protein